MIVVADGGGGGGGGGEMRDVKWCVPAVFVGVQRNARVLTLL